MPGVRIDPAALVRGTAVGAVTAALAVAAHGAAGGLIPGGAVTAQLAVLAVTLGAVAATVHAAARTSVLWALLGTGQLLAHTLLAAAGHGHGADQLRPSATMVIAHLAAVSVGAVLIAGGARLCAAVCRAVRAVRPAAGPPPPPARPAVVRSADQPLHSALFLSSSVSHRGPPAGVVA
ncbi:hypothetical protein ACWDTP_28210 [Mycobacterium sp. NPDC003449]